MEQFISEIEAYAAARGVKPTTVVQSAVNASGLVWQGWKSGARSCSVRTMDRIRAFIATNPPTPINEPSHDRLPHDPA